MEIEERVKVPHSFCKQCPYLDIDIPTAIYGYDEVIERVYRCANERMCEWVARHAISRKEKLDDENG